MNKERKAIIEEWFRKAGGGGLVLPDGWFGRPYDNIHRLTFLTIRPFWTIVELDERLLLTLRNPFLVQATDEELLISEFPLCVLDRKEYGGDRYFSKSYNAGEVKIVAPPGA